MLLVSLRDGSVLTLDLGTAGGRATWAERVSTRVLAAAVTGLSLSVNGQRADLPLPRRFRGVEFSAELELDAAGQPAAERVTAFADDVALTLTAYLNGLSGRFRVDLDHRGRARFRPPSFR